MEDQRLLKFSPGAKWITASNEEERSPNDASESAAGRRILRIADVCTCPWIGWLFAYVFVLS
jgi:hypothetical protein